MKLTVLPFRHVKAFADIGSSEIFVAEATLFGADPVKDIKHELAHLASGSPDHDQHFNSCLIDLGGSPVKGPDKFRLWRKRIGMNRRTCCNIGNISGIQNILTDYHLLAAYRKFSMKVLGTEGHWEVLNEGGPGPKNKLIRLYPTPKGVFPVVVLYYPIVTHFRSPQAKKLAADMLFAEAKIMLGHARRKIASMPSPTGATIGLDGADLINEGTKMREELTKEAIELGEPMPIVMW